MNSNIISLLKVPGFRVVDVQIMGEEIIISVRRRSKTARCPCCLKRTKRLKDYRPLSKILHKSTIVRHTIYEVRHKLYIPLKFGNIHKWAGK